MFKEEIKALQSEEVANYLEAVLHQKKKSEKNEDQVNINEVASKDMYI